MDKITDKNKEIGIEILVKSLKNNPGALSVIKKDRNIETRLREFCRFCVDLAILKQGAYITSDQKGVALVFNRKEKGPSFHCFQSTFALAQNVSVGAESFPSCGGKVS